MVQSRVVVVVVVVVIVITELEFLSWQQKDNYLLHPPSPPFALHARTKAVLLFTAAVFNT